jgi:hypothetical protein
MKLKNAARCFGSVGILLPLILIFLVAADATYACPEKRTVSYRTRVISNRSISPMATTVITYGGPARYRGCSDTTKRVKYVAVRGDSYYNTPRYVVARSSDNYYPTRRVRYVSVRNADMDEPRYVVVKRQPVYVSRQAKVFVVKNADIDDASRYIPVERYRTGTRYVAVRSGYRTGNGIVAYVDRDDASPRYVAIRKVHYDDVDYDDAPHYAEVRKALYETSPRYVAVRRVVSDYDVQPARYVAVRNVSNACTCADELNSSLDQIETRTPGHVVVKSDYIDGTEDVIYRGEVVNETYAISDVSYDDDLYPVSPAVRTNYVDYQETVVPAHAAYMPASSTDYDDTSEMPVSYVPAATYNDSNYDEQAILDTDNATFVADTDIDDACLSTVAVQAPMEYRMRTVSYVPVADIDDDDSSDVSMLYGWDDGSDSAIASVPVVNNSYVDTGTTYVVADDKSNSCSCPMMTSNLDDDVDVDTVSYVPASYVNDTDTETVSYVPVDDVATETVSYLPASDIDTSTVSYVPENAMDAETVSYVPNDSVEHVAVADMSADDTSIAIAAVGVPVVDDTSMAVLDENLTVPVAEMVAIQQAAGGVGFNDGLADGRNAAMNLEQNLPANSANFQTATNGYSDTIGNAQIYQDAYRSSYLQGFSEGYNSAIGSS